MNVRNAFMRSLQAFLLLAILLGAVSAYVLTMYDVLKEFSRSSLGQTALTYHEMGTVSSEEPIRLPSTMVRGDYSQVVMHQEVAREIFVRRTLDSGFPLMGVNAEFTPDGYLTQIEPLFAPQPRSYLRKEYVLVFLPGEGMIEECFPRRLEQCLKSTVGRGFQIKRIYTNQGAFGSLMPRLLVIVYGPQEFTT